MREDGDCMFGDGYDLWVEGEFEEGHGAVGVEEGVEGVVIYSRQGVRSLLRYFLLPLGDGMERAGIGIWDLGFEREDRRLERGGVERQRLERTHAFEYSASAPT